LANVIFWDLAVDDARTTCVVNLRRRSGLRRLAAALLIGGVVLVCSVAEARAGCSSPASPGRALKASLEKSGFTYNFTRCTRFGRAYYAFAKDTSDSKHWTSSERVFTVVRTQEQARSAAAFFRSAGGRASFLAAFRALVSNNNPQWTFSLHLTRVSTSGKLVRLEAIARASPR
jgi:hypothetical protein